MNKSTYFSTPAIRALIRLGDIYIPGDGQFPSFSAYGAIEHIDRMAAFAPSEDIRSLNTVLGILARMPNFVLRWLVKKCETSTEKTGGLSVVFRQLDVGFRGLLFGCYYNGEAGTSFEGTEPFEVIGYKVNRMTD